MSKSRIPYFRFYPSDFMHGVRGLSAQEVGVYTMILCRIYEECAPLEYNTLRLSTYCGMRENTFKKVTEKLIDLGKLSLEKGMLSNERAELEIAKRANDLKNNSKAGKASAEKRQQNQRKLSTDVQQPFNHTDTDTDIAATQPHARGKSQAENLEGLQQKLVDAAGEKIHPHGVFDLSAIIGLIAAGVDLETDILPTIKARCATMKRPARGWSYFTDAIKDAHNRRIEAGNGISKPKETVKPDSELSEEVLEAEWKKRLDYARRNRTWFTAAWGEMPNKEGCRVPEHLLQPNDGKHPHGGNWIEQ